MIFVIQKSISLKVRSGEEYLESCQRGVPFARVKVFANLSSKELSSKRLIYEEGPYAQCPLQAAFVEKLRLVLLSIFNPNIVIMCAGFC